MEENNIWTIYEHISPSGKVYVGITSRPPKYRWNSGKGYTYNDDQKAFKSAILKYGWDNFKHIIIASNLGEKTAKNMEKDLIAFNKARKISYNMTNGGDGVLGCHKPAGYKLSEETKLKMSIARQGTNRGEDNPMYGRHETAPMYGKFGKEHPASKPIYQYSLDGKLIKRFNSLSEAALSLGNAQYVTHITACAKGKLKTALGYQWRYNNNKQLPVMEKLKIYQYLPFTGTLYRQYNSCKEIEEYYSRDVAPISSCLHQKLETAFGFIWSHEKYNIFPVNLSYRSIARLIKYTKKNTKYFNEDIYTDKLNFDKQKSKEDLAIKRIKARSGGVKK